MMRKVKLVFYYLIIAKLPHSRLFPFFNRIRCWYVGYILNIFSFPDPHIKFQNNIYIGDGTSVKIGYGCHINENVFIQAAFIGNQVLIAPNVSILGNTHITSDINTPIVQQGCTNHSHVKIGDGSWLGRNVIVMPGICIGREAIIGAGAVVTKDIPDYAVAVGVPAKVIKMRK